MRNATYNSLNYIYYLIEDHQTLEERRGNINLILSKQTSLPRPPSKPVADLTQSVLAPSCVQAKVFDFPLPQQWQDITVPVTKSYPIFSTGFQCIFLTFGTTVTNRFVKMNIAKFNSEQSSWQKITM